MTPLPSSPAALRNREPIRDVLQQHLPATGRVLEIAAGTGEHGVFLAAAFPRLAWTPADADPRAIEIIARRRAGEGPANLLPPVLLDAANPDAWPLDATEPPPDAIVCINMIHIAPWAAAEGLFTGAGRLLPPDGLLILYGPYREADVTTASSNEGFDASLKARDPAWGLRDLADVDALAERHGLTRAARYAMPANNLTLMYRREAQ